MLWISAPSLKSLICRRLISGFIVWSRYALSNISLLLRHCVLPSKYPHQSGASAGNISDSPQRKRQSAAVAGLDDHVGLRLVRVRRPPILLASRPVQLVAVDTLAMKNRSPVTAVQQ